MTLRNYQSLQLDFPFCDLFFFFFNFWIVNNLRCKWVKCFRSLECDWISFKILLYCNPRWIKKTQRISLIEYAMKLCWEKKKWDPMLFNWQVNTSNATKPFEIVFIYTDINSVWGDSVLTLSFQWRRLDAFRFGCHFACINNGHMWCLGRFKQKICADIFKNVLKTSFYFPVVEVILPRRICVKKLQKERDKTLRTPNESLRLSFLGRHLLSLQQICLSLWETPELPWNVSRTSLRGIIMTRKSIPGIMNPLTLS